MQAKWKQRSGRTNCNLLLRSLYLRDVDVGVDVESVLIGGQQQTDAAHRLHGLILLLLRERLVKDRIVVAIWAHSCCSQSSGGSRTDRKSVV